MALGILALVRGLLQAPWPDAFVALQKAKPGRDPSRTLHTASRPVTRTSYNTPKTEKKATRTIHDRSFREGEVVLFVFLAPYVCGPRIYYTPPLRYSSTPRYILSRSSCIAYVPRTCFGNTAFHPSACPQSANRSMLGWLTKKLEEQEQEQDCNPFSSAASASRSIHHSNLFPCRRGHNHDRCSSRQSSDELIN